MPAQEEEMPGSNNNYAIRKPITKVALNTYSLKEMEPVEIVGAATEPINASQSLLTTKPYQQPNHGNVTNGHKLTLMPAQEEEMQGSNNNYAIRKPITKVVLSSYSPKEMEPVETAGAVINKTRA